MLILPDRVTRGLVDAISREIEYQRGRGFTAQRIDMSPECHEGMRTLIRAPRGAILREQDGVPVHIDRKLIGLKSWKIHYDKPAPTTEAMVDAVRQGGSPVPMTWDNFKNPQPDKENDDSTLRGAQPDKDKPDKDKPDKDKPDKDVSCEGLIYEDEDDDGPGLRG